MFNILLFTLTFLLSFFNPASSSSFVPAPISTLSLAKRQEFQNQTCDLSQCISPFQLANKCILPKANITNPEVQKKATNCICEEVSKLNGLGCGNFQMNLDGIMGACHKSSAAGKDVSRILVMAAFGLTLFLLA
ncbi:uncharacterized protein VTP21DRAFT_1674 [Calcarisporiella thermophila]|uniref:uncharacterized protein n=1 Tax=Calcarisporiella thermophila TaxID=911321 RepID=UPI003742E852